MFLEPPSQQKAPQAAATLANVFPLEKRWHPSCYRARNSKPLADALRKATERVGRMVFFDGTECNALACLGLSPSFFNRVPPCTSRLAPRFPPSLTVVVVVLERLCEAFCLSMGDVSVIALATL